MIDLPHKWDLRPLSDVCQPVAKMDPIATGRASVRYVDIGSVDGVTHRLGQVPEIDSATAPSRCRQVLRSGDTVFSTVRPYLEKIAYIDPTLDMEFASTGFCVLRPTEILEPRFLFHFASSKGLLDQVLPMQKGVNYPAVLDREVRRCAVPVPPLPEQRRIVDFLEENLSSLDEADHDIANARHRADALEISWLRRNLTGPDDELHLLGDLLTEARGGWSRSQRHLVSRNHGIPYLKMNNITSRGRLDLSNLVYVEADGAARSKFAIRPGDVLFNSKNSAELVGKTAVADERVRGAIINENLMRLRFDKRVIPDYAGLWFLGPIMRAAIGQAARASTNVSAVYQHRLIEMPIWVPSRQHQLSLVANFRDVRNATDSWAAHVVSARKRSRALRQALLTAAFSGRLTGRTSDSELAEELADQEAS